MARTAANPAIGLRPLTVSDGPAGVAGLTAFSVEADHTAEHGAHVTVSLLGSAELRELVARVTRRASWGLSRCSRSG